MWHFWNMLPYHKSGIGTEIGTGYGKQGMGQYGIKKYGFKKYGLKKYGFRKNGIKNIRFLF